MKQIYKLIALTVIATFLCSCASYQRIGNLTMISTRNIDSKTEYKLIQKDVEGKAKMKHGDALQQAIDEAVKQFPEGEFLKNVYVYVKSNGRWVKVNGDVWGIPSVEKSVTKSVTEKIEFKVGDKVAFKKTQSGKLIEGKIVGVNQDSAIIEYKNAFGNLTKDEVKYEKLTKLQ